MRSRLNLILVVSLTIFSLGLTGCTKPLKGKGGSGTGAGADGLGGAGTIGGGTGGDNAMGGRDSLGGAWKAGEFAPVYFEFDSAKVKPSEVSKLQAVAARLKGGNLKLVIEGHADERGTAEYNRALGERRAQACREELVSLGVPAANISTSSYGEEKPADPGHDEGAWSKNRRCEFMSVGN